MPQVHINGKRYRVSRDALANTIQRYTGKGMVEARRLADRALAGERLSLYVDDFDSVYDLEDMLMAMGINAEADESDY